MNSAFTTFRRAAREDLPAIVALLDDDVLGAKRERYELPLPLAYDDAFDAIDRDPNNELYVRELETMERFCTDRLGFVVTDDGAGDGGMVFLSRNPDEHHQIVLNPRPGVRAVDSPVDHLSLHVASLADLRRFLLALADSAVSVRTVSHGMTWSIYSRDPEENRPEIFVDTPWHVAQPCRPDIDLSLSDEELHALTLARIEGMPGFRAAAALRRDHVSAGSAGRRSAGLG